MPIQSRLTFATRVDEGVADVRPRVEAARRAEGFRVLTEIDVPAAASEVRA